MAIIKSKGKGKDRRWVLRYDGTPDVITGKRKQLQKTFKSQREAKEFLDQISFEKAGLVTSLSTKKTFLTTTPFKEYAKKWFEGEYFQNVRVNTFKIRRFYLEKHLVPFFGDKPLSSVTADDVKEFYKKLKVDGYATKTISSLHKFLSTLLQSAVDNGDLEINPMSGIKKKPKDPIRVAQPWSYNEIHQFLEVAEREAKDVMYDFVLSSGLRQGEVFALPWYNIDFERETVTVTQSVSYDANGVPELIPKGEGSHRTLSIPSYLVAKLEQHKRIQDMRKEQFGDHYQHDLNLVFPKTDGGFHNPNNIRRQLYGLMKKAKVRRITFHDLRHTHASMLIRSGAQPKIVQARLGHKDIETTFRYYAHLWPNADQEAVKVLEKMMAKERKS